MTLVTVRDYTMGSAIKRTILALSATLCMMAVSSLGPAHANPPQCDVRDLANRTKTIAKLAAFQDSLNFLAVSQSIAVIEIETGAPVWPIHVEETEFFGPLIGLRKFTDKTETYLSNLDKDIRRIPTFDGFADRYVQIDRANKGLVKAGYDILKLLEEGNAKDAREALTDVTLPTLERVRGDIYTIITDIERSVTLDALRCRGQ